MYTFKMDIYIYKIIKKQSEKIVQTKIKSQKLKKKKKYSISARMQLTHRQISSCGSNQGFGSELFPILLSRKMQFAKYLI